MKLDLDDTITAGQRPSVQPTEPDLDDTIIIRLRKQPDVVQPYSGPAPTLGLTSGASEASPASAAASTPATAVQQPPRVLPRANVKQATSARTPAPQSAEALALYYRVQLDGASGAHNLEHPCVFGRDPRPPRIVRGVGPRLVAVQSPTREVSETHVEVRQLGSSVIVTDLRSTNGSIVQVPGNAAQKLRQGESVVVSAGTLVDIGDGNIIRILPRRRLE
ncbi:FHA domain-containing protein [Salinibacterium sp. PAMC 21357]|uniref:FHA domain-containing protein n=1 Tax=Salinibacterium sp. PAMC 21357 TaxID=1112215 RepID=UPI0002895CC9|nr:FHA domain-containing protein [Salinibacterium sp. PAMC 21357]